MTKEGTEVFHSPGHPDPDSARSPQNSKANKVLMEKRRSNQAASEAQHTLKSSKCKRISKSNVMDIIKSQGIWSETDLLALTNDCADYSMDNLKTFIADTPEHVYLEVIAKTWKSAEAPDPLVDHWQNRMEKISSFSLMNCAE